MNFKVWYKIIEKIISCQRRELIQQTNYPKLCVLIEQHCFKQQKLEKINNFVKNR